MVSWQGPLLGVALVAAATLPTLTGCSSEGDSCGPGAAPAGDVVVAGAGVELRFHDLRARANNDCPAADAPAGVVSLTLSGTAVGGTAPLTLCIPRPDRLSGTVSLGSDIQLVDVLGADASCSYRQLRMSIPSGSATASGVCNNGRDPAGFALELAGTVWIDRTCGTTHDTLQMTITGKVAVLPSSS